MQITSMSARVFAAMMAVGNVVAFADSYQWSRKARPSSSVKA